MADKNFKVKSGLQVPSLTTAGPVTTDSAGNVTSSATLPITQGGTGQTSAGNALNALLPLQTSQDNKFLQTNGVTTQWTIPQQQTSTDGTVGYKIYSGTVTPTSPATGDIWIDQTTGNGIQLVRWRKTIASTTTTLTGLDDNNLTLSYTPGNEQVYVNGTLITRGQDYTATNGTSVVLTQSAEIGDTVEIFGNPLFSVTDVYTQAQSNSLYVSKAGFDAAGKNAIINGGMDIWQRGTSSNLAASGYGADRWYYGVNSAVPSGTVSAQAFSPGNAISGYEPQYYKRWNITAHNNCTNLQLENHIEDARNFAGQVVTLSFWAKADASSDLLVYLQQCYQSATVNALFTTQTITSSWTRYSFTFTMPSLSGATIGTSSYLNVIIKLPRGTTYLRPGTYDFWGFQLEVGNVATSFSRAGGTIAGELAACQRYYQQLDSYTIDTNYSTGVVYSSTVAFAPLSFSKMRSVPSIAVSGTWELIVSGTVTAATISPGDIGYHSSQLNITSSGMTLGQACVLRSGGATASIAILAEL